MFEIVCSYENEYINNSSRVNLGEIIFVEADKIFHRSSFYEIDNLSTFGE